MIFSLHVHFSILQYHGTFKMSKHNPIQTPTSSNSTPTDKKHEWIYQRDEDIAIETNSSPTLSLFSTPPGPSTASTSFPLSSFHPNVSQDPILSTIPDVSHSFSTIEQESLSEMVSKMKGDFHLLKALTMTSFSSSDESIFSRGSYIIRKDLFTQIENRLKLIEQSTQIYDHHSIIPPKVSNPQRKSNPPSPNTQLKNVRAENEALKQRLLEFKRHSHSPSILPPNNSLGAIDGASKSIDKAVKNLSPGAKFVAELATMITLEEGHHAVLADIMDRQYGKKG